MKIDEPNIACRFWGYEPASQFVPTGTDWRERAKMREVARAERTTIIAAKFKPTVYGLKTKETAIADAQRIEDATGIEMRIFNHDYL